MRMSYSVTILIMPIYIDPAIVRTLQQTQGPFNTGECALL